MKKLISCALAGIVALACLPFSAAAAEKLPFELKAPAHVSLTYLDGGDSPTTHGFAYSIDNDTLRFFEQYYAAENGEDFLKPYGLSDIYITLQMDWALDDENDSVSGWHYTKYWDYTPQFGFGCDENGNSRVSDWDVVDCGPDFGNTVCETWVFRGVPNDDRLNGNPETQTPGIKDQLRPEQYTYDTENEELKIDFTKHTIYARARFVLLEMKTGSDGFEVSGYSDWSETVGSGKDAVSSGALTAADLPAPDITDLHMTDKDFNGNPVAAFTLTVPDDLTAKAVAVTSKGGTVRVETEARVKGDTDWIEMGNTDTEIRTGELECALLHLANDKHPVVPDGTEIELRCRYFCGQPGVDDVYSEYSEIETFVTTEIRRGDGAVEDDTEADDGDGEPAEKKDECGLCHFCPHPLGVCIFIWIAIGVVVIAAAVVAVIVIRKKKQK